MSTTKTIEVIDDEGFEVEIQLPAKYEVCSRCDGHGTHLNPSIGEHAYTAEEFEDSFDEEERAEYFKHGGRYDVRCEECNGDRVVLEIDREVCKTDEQVHALELYDQRLDDDRQYRREVEAERRMGC